MGVGLQQLCLRGEGGFWVLIGVLKASLCMKLRWSMVQERESLCVRGARAVDKLR